jgi:vanillate O-demethylase ferredoxin subunit
MIGSDSAWLEVRVATIVQVAEGIRSFELRRAGGEALPPFQAGDHVDVLTPSGQVRQYSLANAPGDSHYEIAVQQEPASRGGSTSMHAGLKVGDLLKIGPPRSNFMLEPAAQHVLVAGGIGITPLLSMAATLARSKAPFTLHYFVRSRAHVAYLERIAQWGSALQFMLHEQLSPEQTEQRLREDAPRRPAGTLVYSCGPGPFMEAVRRVYEQVLGAEAVHLEYFQPRQMEETTGDAPLHVCLSRSGLELTVPAHQTILDALAAHGVKVPTSCMQGVCGTCVTRVLEGVPDHRDSFLSEFHRKSNKKIAICVSRAKTERLVLDL